MSFDSDAGYVPDTPGFAIFFLLQVGAAGNWVRAWSGGWDFPVPADAVDTAGGLYVGVGFPTGLPALSDAINGAFDNIDFVMSGLDATAIRLMNADRDAVEGSRVQIGLLDLDEAIQPIGTVDWLWEATAGKPRSSRVGSKDGAVLSIILPTSTAFYDRNQAGLDFWSPNSQRRRSPDDAFFDLIPKMSAGMIVAWPP